MNTYKLSQEGIQADYRKTILMFITVMAVFGFVGMMIASGGDFSSLPWYWWLGIAVAIIGLGGLRASMHAKRRKRLLQGVSLIVSEHSINYRDYVGLTYSITPDQLVSITEYGNGKVKLKFQKNRTATILAYMENRDQMLKDLGEMMRITQK